MPLPSPPIDTRRFQDIVDEIKGMIPRYCPEWTDHNVSDPGIALVELFAWMTEGLLYRANQVPEKNYVQFLDMIGIRLSARESAQAPVTFYLSGPPQQPLTIPMGIEVATTRTETSRAVVFTTEADLVVRPGREGEHDAHVGGRVARVRAASFQVDAAWHGERRAGQCGQRDGPGINRCGDRVAGDVDRPSRGIVGAADVERIPAER